MRTMVSATGQQRRPILIDGRKGGGLDLIMS